MKSSAQLIWTAIAARPAVTLTGFLSLSVFPLATLSGGFFLPFGNVLKAKAKDRSLRQLLHESV